MTADGNTYGMAIDGLYNQHLGSSVSSAGDVNGDGIKDIIITAMAGKAYVIYGHANEPIPYVNLAAGLDISAGFVIRDPTVLEYVGITASWVGDVNNDSIDDIIIGSHSDAPSGGYMNGAAYIIYGTKGKVYENVDLSKLDISQGFKISGNVSMDQLGHSVGYAGDVNFDGIDDILVGALTASTTTRAYAGEVYVIYGKSGKFSANIDLKTGFDISQGFKMIGANYDELGSSVSYAGDINKDGIHDIILGTISSSPNGQKSGTAYVIYGKAGGFSQDIDVSTLKISDGFKITGTPGAGLGSRRRFQQ